MAYPDDFNRADGSLGSGWTVLTGSFGIVSYRARATTAGLVYATGQSETGQTSHYLTFNISGGLVPAVRVLVNLDSDSNDCWWGSVSKVGGNLRVSVGYIFGVSDIAGSYQDVSLPADGNYTLTVANAGANITATVGGTTASMTNDNSYESQGRFGFGIQANGDEIESFDTAGGVDPTLTIAPDEVYSGNPLSGLSATLTNAEWSSVDPPSSSLSVDHGWILFQTMETTTRFNFSWQAMTYVGTVTVTDEETGATGTFYASGTPVEGGTDSWPLTEAGADLINRSGEATPDPDILLTTLTEIETDGPKITQALNGILEQLGGYYGQVGPDIGAVSIPDYLWQLLDGKKVPANTPWTASVRDSSVKVEIEAAVDQLAAIRTVNDRTLQDVIDYLQGDPLYTLESLHADIVAIGAPDLSSVLNAISALDAKIDAMQLDVDALTTKLGQIQPSTSYSLTTLHNENAALGVDITTLLSLIGTLMGGEAALTIQMVLDAIAVLSADTPPAPPIWPGLATAVLGTPTALLDHMDIPGPMDGLIVAATGVDAGTLYYTYHDVLAYRKVGALAFYTDRGDIEQFQPLGFQNAIYTPKTMTRAGGAKLFTSRGLSGTVRTWTIP